MQTFFQQTGLRHTTRLNRFTVDACPPEYLALPGAAPRGSAGIDGKPCSVPSSKAISRGVRPSVARTSAARGVSASFVRIFSAAWGGGFGTCDSHR